MSKRNKRKKTTHETFWNAVDGPTDPTVPVTEGREIEKAGEVEECMKHALWPSCPTRLLVSQPSTSCIGKVAFSDFTFLTVACGSGEANMLAAARLPFPDRTSYNCELQCCNKTH